MEILSMLMFKRIA